MTDWHPCADVDVLRKRAAVFAGIRQFFSERGVLEVDVPVLGETGVTDLHIDSIPAVVGGQSRYLQSSPEYYMKRLLAAGSGAIYCLGKAFRDGESGRRHNPEFTLLEWYRPGWSEHQLMAELVALVSALADEQMPHFFYAYRDVFFAATGLDPHQAGLSVLQQLASELSGSDFSRVSRSECLDLIFSLSVEPQLPDGLVLIGSYPSCQAALARVAADEQGVPVARRFEVFLNRMELANGYFELTDPIEQRSRFLSDQALRQSAGKPAMAMDEKLLAALEAGLPDCAGVALGVDRLLMQLLGKSRIDEVIAFRS